MSRNVALLGGGKMAEALISGLIRSGGRTADELMVTARRDVRARELAGKYGIAATLDNAQAARWANVLVLMAKPQDMEALLGQIREHVTTDDLVISFAAGIRTSFVEKHLPDGSGASTGRMPRPGSGSRSSSPGRVRNPPSACPGG